MAIPQLNIAIVLNTSWNVYNFRLGLIRALQNEGYRVTIIAPHDEYTSRLITIGCDYETLSMDSRGANPVKDLGLFFELTKIYRKVRPDIALQYTIKPNIYGTMAARRLGIPVINNVCGLGTVFLHKSVVSNIASFMYKVTFRRAQKVFFQNNYDRRFFLRKGFVQAKMTDLVPGSGIDLKKFEAVAFKRNKIFTFLLISRLIHDKGILEFIEAIKILKAQGVEARFQLLGAKDPAHKRGIDPAIVDQWIHANFVEYLGTTDDVRSYIRNADCVVLPSYREGTPKTLLEAASSSKPVVATDVPGCREVVTHDYNGFLCKVRDPEDLAEKMHQIISLDNIKLQEMGNNGRLKVEKEFDEKIVINKYLSSIRELLPQKA